MKHSSSGAGEAAVQYLSTQRTNSVGRHGLRRAMGRVLVRLGALGLNRPGESPYSAQRVGLWLRSEGSRVNSTRCTA